MPHSEELQNLSVDQLQQKAKQAGISGYSSMKKDELIKAIEGHQRHEGGERGSHR